MRIKWATPEENVAYYRQFFSADHEVYSNPYCPHNTIVVNPAATITITIPEQPTQGEFPSWETLPK